MALTKVTRNLLSTGIDDQSNATAITIDSSENVGIGTTSPASKLHIAASSYTAPTGGLDANINLLINNTQYSGIQILGSSTGSSFIHFGDQNNADVGIITYEHNGDYMRFDVNATERMRIDSSGRVIVTSASTSTSNGYLYLKGNTTNFSLVVADSVGSNFYPATFRNNSNTEVGSISATQSATSYNTSSDYRLKENVVEMEGAIDRVKLLQPKRFNFIATPEDTVDGFIAHEVSDIVPEAIHGVKDEVDEEGNPVYQGIDQSKLVPLLTKAIQEQQTIIDDLKARIETLENA
jgi:hypothetical protein